MSPVASTSAWRRSRHHDPSTAAPAPPSAIVLAIGRAPTAGTGSPERNAMLNSAAPDELAPPGAVAVALPAGFAYVPAPGSHSPTPAAIRTTDACGSQAACGTRT